MFVVQWLLDLVPVNVSTKFNSEMCVDVAESLKLIFGYDIFLFSINGFRASLVDEDN